jgi:DNA-binding FadR family transcriptional regulator
VLEAVGDALAGHLIPETKLIVESLVRRTVFTPIRQGSAVAETVARLGQAIALGLLRPGDRLPAETKLAQSLGISAVTLRGALGILREAGVLETRRGRGGGTFVSVDLPPNPVGSRSSLPAEADLRDLIDYRCVVEGGAAALAAERATAEQISHLGALVRQMDEESDFGPWSEMDTLFHLILADASGSHRLVSEVTELRSAAYHISDLWKPVPVTTMRVSNEGHREILRAVKARKPERARAAMMDHVETTLGFWLGLQPGLASAQPERIA